MGDLIKFNPPGGSISAGENLPSAGGGDNYGGMGPRIEALENRMTKVEEKLDKVLLELAEMKGKLSSIPNTWQIGTLIIAIMGASFAVIRFGLGN